MYRKLFTKEWIKNSIFYLFVDTQLVDRMNLLKLTSSASFERTFLLIPSYLSIFHSNRSHISQHFESDIFSDFCSCDSAWYYHLLGLNGSLNAPKLDRSWEFTSLSNRRKSRYTGDCWWEQLEYLKRQKEAGSTWSSLLLNNLSIAFKLLRVHIKKRKFNEESEFVF